MDIAFRQGSVEVICGPMFSGKTEELIRLIRRAQIARVKVQIFKPSIDIRYDKKKVVSHAKSSVSAEGVGSPEEIILGLDDRTRIVAIDEIQFFGETIIDVVERLARRGLRVICAGLDLDYLGKPFGSMPNILAIADSVRKLKSICTVCGQPASRSQRIIADDSQVLIGELKEYEARCASHWEYEAEVTSSAPEGAPAAVTSTQRKKQEKASTNQ